MGPRTLASTPCPGGPRRRVNGHAGPVATAVVPRIACRRCRTAGCAAGSIPPARRPGAGVCGSAPTGCGGVLRPTFLRADVQGRWGASKTIKYTAVAERLTVGGYPTKADELKNARRAAPVPPTGAFATASDSVMKASAGNRIPW